MSRADKKPRNCRPKVEWKRKLFLSPHKTQLCRLHSKGLTDEQIANALGFDFSTIRRQRQKLGLICNRDTAKKPAPRKPSPTPAETQKIISASLIVKMKEIAQQSISSAKDYELRQHFGQRLYINGEYRLDGHLTTQTKAIVAMQKERIDRGMSPVRFY